MGKRCIPRRLSRKVKKKSAGITVAIPGVCLLLLVALAGAVIGRYQHQFDSGGSVRAKEFYFTSDFLDGGTHTLAPGSTEMTFTLGNHEDELRYSEVDITYEVEVTAPEGAQVKVQYDKADQKLTHTGKEDHKVTIIGLADDGTTPSELTPGTYTIKATGTGGYKKTLTATVEVLAAERAVYKYLDTANSAYVLLTVWAQGYEGDVTIAPPAEKNLIPDNTDPVMKDATTGAAFKDEESFQTNGYSSHTYRFFGGGVTADDFTVTYDDGKTAGVRTPS